MAAPADNSGGPQPGQQSAADPLHWFLLRDLSVAAERVGRALAASYDEAAGLNLAEGRVLLVLTGFPAISAGEVTSRTTMDKARVSRALAKLILVGMVTRKTHRSDRRQVVLGVTAKGRRTAARIEEAARTRQAAILAGLSTSEQDELRRALQSIRTCADAYLRQTPADAEAGRPMRREKSKPGRTR
jgi:DNA-binding MarR family transcriptional regulator